METAMCLIESNQPVHPLSIVRQMRDQRAMLIQTSVSFCVYLVCGVFLIHGYFFCVYSFFPHLFCAGPSILPIILCILSYP